MQGPARLVPLPDYMRKGRCFARTRLSRKQKNTVACGGNIINNGGTNKTRSFLWSCCWGSGGGGPHLGRLDRTSRIGGVLGWLHADRVAGQAIDEYMPKDQSSQAAVCEQVDCSCLRSRLRWQSETATRMRQRHGFRLAPFPVVVKWMSQMGTAPTATGPPTQKPQIRPVVCS